MLIKMLAEDSQLLGQNFSALYFKKREQEILITLLFKRKIFPNFHSCQFEFYLLHIFCIVEPRFF